MSLQLFLNKAKAKHGDRYDYSQVDYKDNKTTVTIVCPKHGPFRKIPSLHTDRGSGCPGCLIDHKQPRMSTSEFVESAQKKHGDRYSYENVVYVNAITPVVITCNVHGNFKQTPNTHLNGSGCQACGGRRSITRDQFILEATATHGNLYNYESIDFVNLTTPISIVCHSHGTFVVMPWSHLSGQRCMQCSVALRYPTSERFIQRCKEIHKSCNYDYTDTVYTRLDKQISVVCPKHGKFLICPKAHLVGVGCKVDECNKRGMSTKVFTDRLFAIYPQYQLVGEFVNSGTNVELLCTTHHVKSMAFPRRILRSIHSCWQCTLDKKKVGCQIKYGTDHHKQKNKTPENVALFHNKEWLYEQHVVLKRTAADIAAPLGYNPNSLTEHMAEIGIPVIKWGHTVSEAERQICAMLAEHTTVVRSSRNIIAPKELDMYLPEFNIAIEYCGLYWHSENMNKDRHYHLSKLTACNDKGIRLITIFEDEWRENSNLVMLSLLHMIKKNNAVACPARSCKVQVVPGVEEAAFLDKYHIQGHGPGSLSYGLYDSDQLVAIMTFIVKKGGVFILNRYATSKPVVGGFSKLLAHFKTNNTWTSVISFADRRWSEGDLYYKAGFMLDGVVPPDYAYTYGSKRFHKFNFRHKNLAKILPNYDSTLSEAENMKRSKYDRIWNCGLLRFKITNTKPI